MARLLGLAAAVAAAAADDSIVNTKLGPVQGLLYDTHRAFIGVPFGQPPVGPLRWADPQMRTPWTQTWQAQHDPPGCMQICTDDEPPHICPAKMSEDCLYLNVFTPRTAVENAPVLLFFHGGNFHDGYAGGPDLDGGLLYDGTRITNSTGAVVVVAQYRLGVFGELFLGPSTTVSGNYGLKDQVLAMEWVRANIGAFGGNPAQVTLMGQSAGAMSISIHLTRPQTNGLYAAAIQHSNPFAEPYRTPDDALSIASVLANYTGCGTPIFAGNWSATEACLRTIDAQTLVKAGSLSETAILADLHAMLQIVVAWGPTIDGQYLKMSPLDAWQAGQVNDVPLILGTTANETVLFVYEAFPTTPLPQILYDAVLALLVSPFALGKINDLYTLPNPVPADLRLNIAPVLTDALFYCATRNATEALLAAQPYRKSPVFIYQYSHVLSWGPEAWGNYSSCDNYACHGSDLPQWWMPTILPTGEKPGFGNFTAEELDLGFTMERYWANFAATGVPGAAQGASPTGGVAWPAYSAATRQILDLNAASGGGISVLTRHKEAFCDFWDANGYNLY